MNLLNAAINSTYQTYQPGIKEQKKPNQTLPDFSAEKRAKVKKASFIGTVIGIIAAVCIIYNSAKHRIPEFDFKKYTYNETDIITLGSGSILGGLIGGTIADKNEKNQEAKVREASQQYFGSLLCPVGILALAEKGLEKSKFALPKINSTKKIASVCNRVLGAIPKIVVTIGSLVAGMELGNFIMNKINNKLFKEEVKHDVAAADYLVHTDDACLALNMLLKDSQKLSGITTKVLPVSFILAGTKTGMKEAE